MQIYFELDKYENSFSLNFSIFNKHFRLVHIIKRKEYKQHLELLELMKEINENRAELIPVDFESLKRSLPPIVKRWRFHIHQDYSNIFRPSHYNWINFTLFESIVEKDLISFAILGLGFYIEKS